MAHCPKRIFHCFASWIYVNNAQKSPSGNWAEENFRSFHFRLFPLFWLNVKTCWITWIIARLKRKNYVFSRYLKLSYVLPRTVVSMRLKQSSGNHQVSDCFVVWLFKTRITFKCWIVFNFLFVIYLYIALPIEHSEAVITINIFW